MDTIFNYMQKYDYENLFFCQDKELDFQAVIAIHDTTLGPAAVCGTAMTVNWMPLKMPCAWHGA